MRKCELCQTNQTFTVYLGIPLCRECHELAVDAWENKPDALKKLKESANYPRATTLAKNVLIAGAARKWEAHAPTLEELERKKQEEERHRLQAEKQRRQEEEQQRQEEEVQARLFAQRKVVNDLYEYDIVVVPNDSDGTVDKWSIQSVISEHAKLGWRLHTIYSNEVGKNSSSVGGYGTNATICQDVLIFERRIERCE